MQTGRETQLDLRVPKVFLLPEEAYRTPVNGLMLVDQSRKSHAIYDISMAGFVCDNFLPKARIGDRWTGQVRFESLRDPLLLSARVSEKQHGLLWMAFNSLTSEHRLHLDQPLKDALVQSNLKALERPQALWVHGPFDTDFYVQAEPFQAFVEYDGLTMIFEDGEWKQQKSAAVVPSTESYLSVWRKPTPHKVSRGASWLDRLLKLEHSVLKLAPQMDLLFENLHGLKD